MRSRLCILYTKRVLGDIEVSYLESKPVSPFLLRITPEKDTMRPSAQRAALAGVAITSLLLTACRRDTLDPGGPQAAAIKSVAVKVVADPNLEKLVPPSTRSQGTLTIGTDASYAPNEYTVNGNHIQGMDIDLLTAIATKLGLKLNFQNGNFDSLVGGVGSGKYAMGISSFTINPDREKQILMVEYFNAGTGWATAKGNPKNINIDDLCGKSVGIQKATVQVDDVTARSKKCTAAGKPAISQVVEDAQSKVTADLLAGKVVAMAADSPVAYWAVAQNAAQLDKLGSLYDAAPYGVAVPKSNPQLATAVSKAFEALKNDGTYAQILKNWNNADGAVSTFPVNPQVSG